jgi:hypothetical protein
MKNIVGLVDITDSLVGVLSEQETLDGSLAGEETLYGSLTGNTNIHSELTGREQPNQHPIKAITGLSEYIDALQDGFILYCGSATEVI